MENGARFGARERRSVLLVVLVALFVRLAVLWLARDAEPWNDQVTYVQRAEDLLDGKGYTGSYQSWVQNPGERQLQTLPRYPGAYQAPGFPAFMALVMAVCGRDELWIRVAQVLLGAATTWFVYGLGRASYSHRVGLAAAWFFALDPTLVSFTHYLFNETLFIFLLTAALHLLARSRGVPNLAIAAGAGALFAAASYVKSSVLYLLPLLAAWYAWHHRAELGRALRFLLVAALAWSACVAPWAARNASVHGGFVLIDSSGPYNLWRGNQPNAYARRRAGSDWNVRFPAPFSAYSVAPVAEVGGSKLVEVVQDELGVDAPTDLQMMEGSQRAALRFITEDWVWTLERAWYKTVDVWNPTSFVMRHLFKDGYGEIPPLVESALSWACVLAYLAVLLFALPAMWMHRHDAFTSLVLLLVYYYTAIHAVTFGLTRFRLPIMPFLMVLAGVGWVAWRDRKRSGGVRAA
jgi:4-amino-4-deoxy-L-arabinose transferase-like glycosyltransferase